MSIWRNIVGILDIRDHVYVWEASCKEFGFEPGLDPFEPPALRRQNSHVDVVEIVVLVDPVFVDKRVLSNSFHQSEAKIAVDSGDTPSCRDEFPSLVLTEHAAAKRPLNPGYKNAVSV